MKRLLLMGLCLASLGVANLASQSNEFLDVLIGAPTVRGDQAAYLVLVASENLPEDADQTRAFEMLGDLGWVPGGMTAESVVTWSDLAYMCMKAFGMNGGILYRLFPGPRYAYREMRYQGILQGRMDPGTPVDGTGALRLAGRILDVKGAGK